MSNTLKSDFINERGFWSKDVPLSEHVHSKELSNWIINFLQDYKDTQIYDFGCGTGGYLIDLKNNGFNKLIGIEGDPIKNNQITIIKKDLSKPLELQEKGIIICLEVGEHIDKKYEEILLKNISDNCNGILITSWAIRNQGGFGHVNELNNDEIIPKFEKFGFKYLKDLSEECRGLIMDDCWWFKNTLMIFKID